MSFNTKELAFVIPFKNDHGYREKIFTWNVRRLRALFPDAQICIGEEDPSNELFNLAQARNDGIKRVDRPYIFSVDADTVWNFEVIYDSVEEIKRQNWVIPYKLYLNINQASTFKILADDPDTPMIYANYGYDAELIVPPPPDPYPPVSGLVCMSTEDMYKIGGFDEAFTGWGWDDRAFAYAAEQILGKSPIRLPHNVYHLWHPIGDTVSQPNYHKNWDLFRQYERDFASVHRKYI